MVIGSMNGDRVLRYQCWLDVDLLGNIVADIKDFEVQFQCIRQDDGDDITIMVVIMFFEEVISHCTNIFIICRV